MKSNLMNQKIPNFSHYLMRIRTSMHHGNLLQFLCIEFLLNEISYFHKDKKQIKTEYLFQSPHHLYQKFEDYLYH